jgi:hypothetical protein
MEIFASEIDDGIAEQVKASSSIAYASLVSKCDEDLNNKLKIKTSAAINDNDLYYVQSILVSSSWNKNDDIFDKLEVWGARKTPEDKPTNLEHDENLIIGHITSNWPIDEQGLPIPEDINTNELPDKFHILTGSVIYRAFSSPDLKARAEKLISEIESGEKYVSMECYFQGFDYGLIDKSSGNYKVLGRNNNTAYLTKFLRAYGGSGEHGNYKIGRVLRNITFSGKGFVDKPANPDSIIFTKETMNKLLNEKNDDFTKSGVISDTFTSNAENITMSEDLEKQVAELTTKLDTVTANCADSVKEAYAAAEQVKEENSVLEAAVKTKEEELKMKEEEMKKMKADFDETLAANTSAQEVAIAQKDAEIASLTQQLADVNEVLAAYKMKEEEMAKKEKKMKRMASLLDAGLDNDTASATVDQFETLDDSAFEAMTGIFAAMKKKATKDEEEAMMMKKKASEDTVEALEQVEADHSIDLGVGDDTADHSVENVRAELIEFVSARLSKTSNKGE